MVVIADYKALREAFVVKGDEFAGRPDKKVDKRFTFCENQGVKLSITEYLRCLSNIEDKTKVDMRWPIQLMIANIINETLFGYRYDYDNCDPLINYVEAFNKLMKVQSSALIRYFAIKFKWIRHIPIVKYYVMDRVVEFYDLIMSYIRTNVDQTMDNFDADKEPDCFVHAYAKKLGTSPYLTKEQLYATCYDFFLAGQETTTTTLRWAMLLMAANQDKQILRVVGSSRLPSMADRRDMPYTMATVHEVQRWSNILMMNVSRKTVVDTQVMEFRPERYLPEDGKTLKKELIDRTVPFSMGRRQCAGEVLPTEENIPATNSVKKKRISWSEVSIDDVDENYKNESDEMRLEDLGNDLQPYTVNLNELPEALQEQVFREIQLRGMNNHQYYLNGQSRIKNSGYTGISKAGMQYSSPPPYYGYGSNQYYRKR
ncbi:hypothetical protein PRIPAC_78152 [Pristionchus pacificus]|uniref:Cytochrome P450 n=1 Tax=Pristionchus pacificus TaxID=54126 RepID=A0A2A6C4D5_PRIPA|nr:hypothetical protein PRIPAC_78152 [Pristionchus pacificus]|eukprot:PDM72999.1 cytochrome P450 [Pristionchus pacificus]